MYAIIADGSHQYRVEPGQVLDVDRKDLDEGADSFTFDRVLLVGGLDDGPRVGRPTVEGARVTASVVGEVKAKKIIVQKFRRRKKYRVKQGHRQPYLRVRIDAIEH